MNRRQFFKTVAVTAATAVVVPSVLAKDEPVAGIDCSDPMKAQWSRGQFYDFNWDRE